MSQNATNGSGGQHRLKFDWTVTFGGLATLFSVVVGGIGMLIAVTGQFHDMKGALRELSTKVEVTMREHDRRLESLERRAWREQQ